MLSYASLARFYATNTHINKLQAFQNKVLRLITKLLRVSQIIALHEEMGMSIIRSHFKRLARAPYQKSATVKTARSKN
jgi:hypothetical protein